MIDIRNQENVIVVFQVIVKMKESKGKYYFVKNIIFEIEPQYF